MPDSTRLTRRSFIKGSLALAAFAPAGTLLAACSAQEPAASTSEPAVQPSSSSSSVEAAETTGSAASSAAPSAGPVLVAYFSATGNTERIAQIIADHLDAETFAITPVQPYVDADLDYNNDQSRTSIERNDPDRNVELEEVTPAELESCQTVFIGYPIWWGDASWVMDNFVAGNDFSGKTVVPFCTSGSSPIGSSGQHLASLAGTGTWLDGERFSGNAAEEDVTGWVDSLGLGA